MNLISLWVLLIGFTWLTGCNETSQSSLREPDRTSVPYYTVDEFKAMLAEDDRLVLVEFCVPHGCFRCDEMRPQINRLANDERDRTVVHRIDLTRERTLANQLGVTMCPSYVAFRNGEEVFRTEFPTSSDLIAVEISRLHQSTESQQLSIQSVH